VPLATRTIRSCVGAVVRRMSISYDTAPRTGFHESIHFCPPDDWSRRAVTLSGTGGALAIDPSAAALSRAILATYPKLTSAKTSVGRCWRL